MLCICNILCLSTIWFRIIRIIVWLIIALNKMWILNEYNSMHFLLLVLPTSISITFASTPLCLTCYSFCWTEQIDIYDKFSAGFAQTPSRKKFYEIFRGCMDPTVWSSRGPDPSGQSRVWIFRCLVTSYRLTFCNKRNTR